MTTLTLEPCRTAILVIDLQVGVTSLSTAPHSAATVVANTARILSQGRKAGATVILVHVDADAKDRLAPEADEPRRIPVSRPDNWANLVSDLERAPGDLTVLKRQWGAFYGTDLDLLLRRRGLTTLLLCGIATEYGVESTARDAYERGYDQVFVSDAMAALTTEAHTHCMTRIFPRMGRVRDTKTVLAALRVGTSSVPS